MGKKGKKKNSDKDLTKVLLIAALIHLINELTDLINKLIE